ncbi:RNA-guided endonuclease TnpB family protein [Nocardiopsis sp. JB363]|uniref:RNA-guided endonuclease TnpB family protein n=1 Tax=Nocardiopsis sp. JB363 TaxID=1434837 RepID=UPI00097AFB5F|nr:RNA-guided endonuclease TnpB family protein [Nocardiopsis sp. JB363]SIO89860.1 Mobile element protein [Nocardiopsis sp. JB363]
MVAVQRAFKFALDPTPTQLERLSRYAGASRMAYNFALGLKGQTHQQWRSLVDELIAAGLEEKEAHRRVQIKTPTKPTVQKIFNQLRGGPGEGPGGLAPWHHEVATWCFQSAWMDADQAWKNWLDSLTGKRAGHKVGYPRFKKKNRSRDSFRLHHDVREPTLRLESYRRLNLGKFGVVRLHESGKRMHRLVSSGAAVVKSVTVSRSGSRWYASVQCEIQTERPAPTRRQRVNGRVGMDVGVHYLAALSQPIQDYVLIDNPRHLSRASKRLARAQRALSRTQKGSMRRRKAAARVGKLHQEVAQQRATTLHWLSKRLATTFACVAIEDLNVAGMTRSARGTVEEPGSNVAAKAGLNSSILDAAPAELRRQLEYKTSWYGSQLAVLDRWFPSSKTCSACGWQNPNQTLADRVFSCAECGLRLDRDLNAARNIAAHAEVVSASGTGTPGRGGP